MKVTLQSSAGVKVRVKEYEDADVLALVQANKVSELTTAINADRRQKVALVDFRSDLSAHIGKGSPEDNIIGLGFNRLTTTVKKDGVDVEQFDETEGEHIKRFIAALVGGHFTPSGFTLPSGDDKVKETAAYAFLQTLADKCGDSKDDDGNPCYVLDVTREPRTGGGGALPKWALEAAQSIINNKSEHTWKANFTNGFTNKRGVEIDPIPFEPFDVTTPHHASAEEKSAVVEGNKKRLARALVAYDKQEKAKTANEFV